ncbi:MAG TPA: vitamin K epoxide reductase family protein [Candidatus Dormibacteraeota bacterium]|nr:vitamin K epoxide reductase family protein [Candidatus Dormibacteraeota bacterium]
MRLQLVALLAAVAGVGVSIYLTAVHIAGIPPACPANAAINCEQVLSSAYGVVAGSAVPTSAAGILWFAVSAVLAAIVRLSHSAPVWSRLQLAWSAIGLVTVLFLVYLEIVRLGVVCVWCSVAHALVLLIFLIALPRQLEGRVDA